MNNLETLFIDAKRGIFQLNGKDLKGVAEFNLTFSGGIIKLTTTEAFYADGTKFDKNECAAEVWKKRT